MSLETQNSPEINAAIDAETTRIINATCEKHQIHPSQLPEGAADDARRAARDMILREEARKANPLYSELEQEREKGRLLQLQLDAVKQSRVNVGNDRRPAVTVAVARAKLGELEWVHRMTDAQRLQAIGVNPVEVTAETKQTILEIFGPHSDHRRASDLMKADSFRYRTLKEIGRALKMI